MNPTELQTAPVAATEVYVFTYGTLRPGQHNARMAHGSVVTAETATVEGHSLYANRSASYPYLVPDGAPGTVEGTLYLMRADERFLRIHQMELGAGYDVATVEAIRADGTRVPALAWVWRRGEWLGERIDSGDWCEWSQSRRPDWSREFRNVTPS